MRRFLIKKTGDCSGPPTPKITKSDAKRLATAKEYEERRRRGFKAAWPWLLTRAGGRLRARGTLESVYFLYLGLGYIYIIVIAFSCSFVPTDIKDQTRHY